MANTEVPPLELALQKARSRPDFLDLCDSRFHQNGFKPPFSIIQNAFEAYREQSSYQPESLGREATRARIAEFYGELGFPVSPADVLLTAGSSESYDRLFRLFCQPEGLIALPRPGYPLFEHLVEGNQRHFVFYDLDFSNDWQIDPDSLNRIKKADLIVLISPNNPTGVCLNETSLGHVRAFCRRTGASWISDEVFDLFVPPGQTLLRPGVVLQELPGFTINGISKRFACPEWKLSWIVISGPEKIRSERSERLEFANDLYLSATSFSQFLGARLFDELSGFQAEMVGVVQENRSTLTAWVTQQPKVAAHCHLGGIYVPLRVAKENEDDEQFSIFALEQEKLLVHPGYYYEFPQKELWIVVSLLKQPADFQAGLTRLQRLIESPARF
ncbi:MAG: pyridoxal phosphate-dependent aminotransferase [Spirochaetales bacterium]|nr:pyridoxal phosphate-dependent aminotransferase [Spirochaetales bacterium]